MSDEAPQTVTARWLVSSASLDRAYPELSDIQLLEAAKSARSLAIQHARAAGLRPVEGIVAVVVEIPVEAP